MKQNRTYLFAAIFFMLGGAALLLAHSSPAMPLRITDVPNGSLGKNVYETYCVACHGEKGDGNGPDAYMMKTKPTDFKDGVYEFKSTAGASLPTKNDIVRTLELGVRTTAMLPQLQLNHREMVAVAGYIMHFSSKFRKEKPGKVVPVPPPPKETASLLRDGKKLFESSCSTCHGTNGEGNGPIANALKDYKGRPIRPANLSLRPLMRSNTPREMYRTIATGLNGTPMASFNAAFKPRQIWSIVDYLQTIATHRVASENRGGGMMGGMGMMGGGMMGHSFVGEEAIGARIDMAAAHAWMMSGRNR